MSDDVKTSVTDTETTTPPVKKRRGRPPKVKEKRPVGRPKGEAAIMKEYRERLLASPKSRKVLDSILNAALDDDHKNQSAAWKLLVDRLMPLSYFEKEKKDNGGASVQISITGIDGGSVSIGGGNNEDSDLQGTKEDEEDYLEGEFEEYSGSDD